MYEFQFPSSGGTMSQGNMVLNYLVIALLVILIFAVLALCVILIIRMRRMKKYSMGRSHGMSPMPGGAPFQAELSKTQAAVILMQAMKADHIPDQEIRSRLTGEYQVEPVLVDALLIRLNGQNGQYR